jgi:glyoxylase-like metal-dependent hydrolase (beta-lactamase superfamily II)
VSGGNASPGGQVASSASSGLDLPALRKHPAVAAFYDKRTGSLQYVVADPVLDFEPKSGATATQSADALLRYVQSEGYVLDWVLDTHPHADHFSAAGYLKDKTGVRIAIGEKVVEVQAL